MENDILTTRGCDDSELVKYMPRLKPEDVAHAVIFAITTPPNVLVSQDLHSVISMMLNQRRNNLKYPFNEIQFALHAIQISDINGLLNGQLQSDFE